MCEIALFLLGAIFVRSLSTSPKHGDVKSDRLVQPEEPAPLVKRPGKTSGKIYKA